MNKVAIKEKVVKANQVSQYRNQNKIVKTIREGGRREGAFNRNSSVDIIRTQLGPEHSFGKQNRPQTPVKGIITNIYGTEAEAFYVKKSVEKRSEVRNNFECETIIYANFLSCPIDVEG